MDKYWTSIGQVLEKCAVDKYAEAEVELDHDDCTLVGIGEHDGRLYVQQQLCYYEEKIAPSMWMGGRGGTACH